MAEIQMPQLGETVTEGTITRWFKAVGDEVAEDEPLFEVSTDKVDSEVPSPSAGYLAEIKVEEGETVDVGTVLAVVSAEAGAPAGDGGPAPDGDAARDDGGGGGGGAAMTALEEEAAEQQADEAQADEDLAGVEGGGGDGDASADRAGAETATAETDEATERAAEAEGVEPEASPDRRPAAPAPASAPAGGEGGGLVLSPVVRRLIAEHTLDPTSIEGTGAGGRITRSDVLRVVEGDGRSTDAPRPAPESTTAPAAAEPAPTAAAQPAPAEARGGEQPAPAPAPAPPPAAPARTPAAIAPPKPGERDTVVALNNIRRRTGEHMVRSKATSPHVFTVMEVDFEGVERVRRAHKDRFKVEEGFGLTYLPFIARALVDAIAEFPHMNATVGEGELIVHHDVNLGIAVDLNYEGLIVPVIRDAQDKRLRAIARQVSDLANRARAKKLSADDITGGSVTITNAGATGTLVNLPVINQPQVMILSTEGVFRKPVVVTDAGGSEAIAVHSVGNLSMAWDHRAFDGAYASAFLRRVCEILESRDWEAEL